MKINESMSINEFMSRDFKKERQIRNRKIGYTLAASTLVFISGFDSGAAYAAESVIDEKAYIVYDKLLVVGKWVIIVKGGMDTINNTVQGDFSSAKKSFLSYLMVYVCLNGLPWAMDQVDALFNEVI